MTEAAFRQGITRFSQGSGAIDKTATIASFGRVSHGVSSSATRLERLFLDVGWRLDESNDKSLLISDLGKTLFPTVVDETCFQEEIREKEQLVSRLKFAFEAEPLEDGFSHHAERIIDDALRSLKGWQVLTWLRGLSLDASDPGFAAAVLRCLARRRLGTPAWHAGIVQSALAADDVEMRDAAVQAAESWGGQEVLEVLGNHIEVIPWLRNYLEDVVEDLRE